MTALLRYQAELLVRSHRLLPPLLLYGIFLAIGVQSGQPVLDSLGYTAAGLLPVAAWLVRVCVAGDPPAARQVAAAATSPARVHLACVLTALLCSTALGALATVVVARISGAHSADHRVAVPVGEATVGGLLAAVACALLGTAVGALCNWPLLRRPGYALLATALAALVALVQAPSPAHAAVRDLVSGSHSGAVPMPVPACAAAALLCAAATAVACALSARRA
ncbi:ABC transporter [Streptomyces sp. AC536]|uniref:ABC transporter n=1 Tax=Streptomyces buecherae TaxID=2763006 RepID=UPI00164E3313|nr:ABC transporter [Streptomyces buecherae]MBC3981549.1 ABC transporter [Streptomyces buecherae]QNJ39558.1 ABC transporter [Streptomyces buecherae]